MLTFYYAKNSAAYAPHILLEYIGADNMGQVPKGQFTTLTSGRAFDVFGNRKVLNYDRQRKSEEAVIEIRVTNGRSEEVDVLLIEHINGDWVIKDESLNYQKKDASTIIKGKKYKKDDLLAYVKDAISKNPEQSVVIAADKKVQYQEVVIVMDLLKQNEINKVGLLLKPEK